MQWWFAKDDSRDELLGQLFGHLVESCASGRNFHWLDDPEGRLGLILALDQLPRNLFRGTAQAFAYDSQTTAWCLAAAHAGQDRALSPVQRAFLYMPLQHAEDLAAQEAGVRLYQDLAQENPRWPVFRNGFAAYAEQHRDIVARFGRFPHRNAVLERESTPEEAAYLAAGAPSFGQ
jgi:uncharacterized protein (DUF924 family)